MIQCSIIVSSRFLVTSPGATMMYPGDFEADNTLKAISKTQLRSTASPTMFFVELDHPNLKQ
jgi:hypothetical protein